MAMAAHSEGRVEFVQQRRKHTNAHSRCHADIDWFSFKKIEYCGRAYVPVTAIGRAPAVYLYAADNR